MINIEREKILHKGYARQSDIRKFIPCGYEKSKAIFEEIRNKSDKVQLDNVVLSAKLLPYVGLTEKQVIIYAQKERELENGKAIC